jgi:Cation transporting ATPase, C-terminus
LIGIAAVVAAQAAFTYLPVFQKVFATEPVSLADGAKVIIIGVLLLLLVEAEKGIAVLVQKRTTAREATKPEHL